eukprot:5960796-Prymnesium_polylepis.1
MRVSLLSGHTPDPVRQDYDYRAQSTDAFDRCIRRKREQSTRELQSEHNLTVVNQLPAGAQAVRGGWKKLIAIVNASARADMLVWHDADAVPNAGGEIVARAMRIAQQQPSVALWLQPGADLVARTPAAMWRSFAGVSLAQVGNRLTTSNGLQTGVILVRASHAVALLGGALGYYSASAEANGALTAHLAGLGVPAGLRGSQEQGPLAHHLLTSAARFVRLVPWLQCEVRRGCHTPEHGARVPSFLHYSGCSFSTKRARKCLARFCDVNASLDA